MTEIYEHPTITYEEGHCDKGEHVEFKLVDRKRVHGSCNRYHSEHKRPCFPQFRTDLAEKCTFRKIQNNNPLFKF